MDSLRDTKVFTGVYQPKYTWSKKWDHPDGHLIGLRFFYHVYIMVLYCLFLFSLQQLFSEPLHSSQPEYILKHPLLFYFFERTMKIMASVGGKFLARVTLGMPNHAYIENQTW